MTEKKLIKGLKSMKKVKTTGTVQKRTYYELIMQTLKQLLFSKQIKEREEQVTKRRQVMEKIVDVVKVIGKPGLSYKGHSESAHTLGDEGTYHGCFI